MQYEQEFPLKRIDTYKKRLQNISSALDDRNGRDDLFADNSNYIDGVKEAISINQHSLTI